jgi:hypothetical protein
LQKGVGIAASSCSSACAYFNSLEKSALLSLVELDIP